MKLLNAKIVRGKFAATRMEWFCGEFESPPWPMDEQTRIRGGAIPKSRYIGCLDITNPSHGRPIFFISKGQPPETFDFQKDAYSSFEQVAMAQMTVMEWDKLKNGDKITLDDEMQENIREWNGRIWMGGSITQVESPEPGINILKKQHIPLTDRLIDGHVIRYTKTNEEY
jgi:hypothetical protein